MSIDLAMDDEDREDRKLFEGYVRTWDEPRPAGLYLTLHHGRDDPQQEMDEFGFDGPIIGPFKWCHITYGTQFNFGFDGASNIETGPCEVVTIVDGDMLKFDGKYYGDWEFQLLEEET